MIPRVLHFVWIQGLAAMPADYWRCLESWAPMHPGWEVRVWDRGTLGWIENVWVWTINNPTLQSEIARFEIVNRHGGIYMDADMECVRPIGDLVTGLNAFASMRNDTMVETAGFGAAADHPWLRDLVQRIGAGRERLRRVLDIETMLRESVMDHREICVFPPAVMQLGADITDPSFVAQMYVKHHRFSLWMLDDERYRDMRRRGGLPCRST